MDDPDRSMEHGQDKGRGGDDSELTRFYFGPAFSDQRRLLVGLARASIPSRSKVAEEGVDK